MTSGGAGVPRTKQARKTTSRCLHKLWVGLSDADANALFVEAYEDLRDRARAMGRKAPPTLQGTAGVNALMQLVLGTSMQFKSKEHFVRFGVVALRWIWASYWRSRLARERREQVSPLATLAAFAYEGRRLDAEERQAAHQVMKALRRDRTVANRREMARAAEYVFIAEMTHAEAAGELGVAKSTVQLRLREFRAWARLYLEPCHREVEALLELYLAQEADADASRIAEVTRRVLLQGDRPHSVAADLQTSEARVATDLSVLRAWGAAKAAA